VIRRHFRRLHDQRLIVVLVSLLLALLAHPVFEWWKDGRILYHIFFDAVLLASLFAVCRSRVALVIATIVGLPAFVLFWTSEIPGVERMMARDVFDGGRHFLMATFLTILALLILWYVMRSERITANVLCGAISVYLLMGLIGGMLYAGLDRIDYRSFQIAAVLKRDASGQQIDLYQRFGLLLYYSFVTQSTVGYGDISPITPPARTLSAIQAVLGQVYLAVLIARFVGLHIAFSARDRQLELAPPNITAGEGTGDGDEGGPDGRGRIED
jgi:hypothetical protein